MGPKIRQPKSCESSVFFPSPPEEICQAEGELKRRLGRSAPKLVSQARLIIIIIIIISYLYQLPI